MSDTLERVEVAELVAMLDGAPACRIKGVNDQVDGQKTEPEPCQRPATWITRLHCGHPFVVCDHHHSMAEHIEEGSIGCADPCKRLSLWGTFFATGPKLVWLPL